MYYMICPYISYMENTYVTQSKRLKSLQNKTVKVIVGG